MPSHKLLVRFSALALLTSLSLGCLGPLDHTIDEEISQLQQATQRRYHNQAKLNQPFTLSPPKLNVITNMSPAVLKELNAKYGPDSYRSHTLDLGTDLFGKPHAKAHRITLNQAIKLAAKNNLAVKIAAIQPEITATQTLQAQAAFDALFFTNFRYSKLDTPRPPSSIGPQFGTSQTDTRFLETGIRKRLSNGGNLTLQTQYTRTDSTSTQFTVNPYHSPNISLTYSLPLMRGFGKATNRAQILLQQNANKNSHLQQTATLIETTLQVVRTYRQLQQAKNDLLIQLTLKDQIIKLRDKIARRGLVDASEQEVSQANNFVGKSTSRVITARQNLRLISDNLKRLINDDRYPLSSEIMLLPEPMTQAMPISINRIDSLSTAMKYRPEIKQAILQISDAQIRQRVADNAKLPQLNLNATVRANGVDANGDAAYNVVADRSFVDYIIELSFEMPFGNRSAKALAKQRLLERSASLANYANNVQQVELEVLNALIQVKDSYHLVAISKDNRLAAADNLRAIEVKEEHGAALTPTFLDQKIQSQQRLAEAETDEIRELANYLTNIDKLYAAMGTILDKHNIPIKTTED